MGEKFRRIFLVKEMWTSLRLHNFKAYADTGRVKLAPLTFLIGPNSGGKSTIIKSFLTLLQTIESRDPKITIVPNGDYCSLGDYSDYVFRGDSKKEIKFELEWQASSPQKPSHRKKKKTPEQYPDDRPQLTGFEVSWGKRVSPPVAVIGFSYIAEDKRKIFTLNRTDRNAYEPKSDIYNFEGHRSLGRTGEYGPNKFYIVSPFLLSKIQAGFSLYLREAQYQFESQVSLLRYLGPLRENPQRLYSVSDERVGTVGSKGDRAASVLYSTLTTDIPKNVDKWVHDLGVAQTIKLKKLKRKFYEIKGVGPTEYESNILDLGFGVSQVLPILVEGLFAPEGSTILLEQPEIHLNPKIQAALGDFFVFVANHDKKQFIIETHSEHLISRVRRLIVSGRISKEDVAVHYCNPTREGAQITSLSIDDFGRFENWPEGFFEEEINEATAISKEIFERRRRETVNLESSTN